MSMELLIYEHDEQVGTVDLDAETYEYDGEKEGIEQVLTKMATEGLMGRVSRRYTAEDGMEMRGSEKYKRTGDGLGRYLKGALEGHGVDGEVQTEAVGFDPDYEMIEIGEYSESEESANEGDQNESIDSTKETNKEPTPSNPNAN